MLLTLFMVPALQVAYLESKDRRLARKLARGASEGAEGTSDSGAGVAIPLKRARAADPAAPRLDDTGREDRS
jgi:hypothetical protein